MNLAKEFETLVVVGLWNKNIFNPEWVGKYLFPGKEIAVEYPLNISGSHRFTADGIRLFVIGNRLNFAAITEGPDSLKKIQAIAQKIADFLPHTPVTAYGVNSVFETPADSKFDSLFENKIKTIISPETTEPIKSTVKNTFKKGAGNLSVTIRSEGDKLKIDFNLHTEIKDLTKLKEALDEGPITEFQEYCKKLAESITSA